MSITLSDGTITVNLHPDLKWSNEYGFRPVQQSTERSVTGALIVSSAAMSGGRPITLEPEDETSAWLSREAVEQLRNWAAVPSLELELTLRGTTRSVIFDGVGLEAEPVVHFSDSDIADDDFYRCTLRFLEI